MPDASVAQVRRWFAYEKESHAKVLAALRAVPPEKRGDDFERAVSLFAHLMAARQLWLFRFGVRKEAPVEFFPKGVSLEELSARVERTQAEWSAYLDRLTDEELGRTFTYKSLDAGWFRNRIEDILTQLFGHSLYHRGQIALLLRQAGAEPVSTDFVFWTREPAPEPG
jgi:uncharacterized damage-inducible protein DinB